MKQFILGFVAALVLIVVGGYAYLALGLAPVATAAPPLPFEKRITSIALNARIDREAPKSSPIPATEEAYAAGAKVYRDHCAVCHGLPGQEQTAIAKGQFPKPPELFKRKGVTDDPVGETYWKVANGIRLTGMPGFSDSLSTEQMWQVSLFLLDRDKLPPTVLTALQAPLPQ
jgi:thiosulfate dehydrogenase